ncbi:MAG: hypothetical protein RIE60_15940 [Roseovarius sp.]
MTGGGLQYAPAGGAVGRCPAPRPWRGLIPGIGEFLNMFFPFARFGLSARFKEGLGMEPEFPTAFNFQVMLDDARNRLPDLYQRWCRLGSLFASIRHDELGHSFEHLDANFDLVLRMLEQEQSRALGCYGKKIEGGVMFAQISLSKMWLFSVYEIVRQTCETPCAGQTQSKSYCHDNACVRCKALRPVRDRLNRFRVPLAKLQYEYDRVQTGKQSNYHAKMVIGNESGSIGWETYSSRTNTTETASRLELSNFILDTLEPFAASD